MKRKVTFNVNRIEPRTTWFFIYACSKLGVVDEEAALDIWKQIYDNTEPPRLGTILHFYAEMVRVVREDHLHTTGLRTVMAWMFGLVVSVGVGREDESHPSLWRRETTQKVVSSIDKQLFAEKPHLKGWWLKTERLMRVQRHMSDHGWTYETGFGYRQAKQWVERAWYGPLVETPSPTSREFLAKLDDSLLMETWYALQKKKPIELALEDGPCQDTPTLSDWARACYFELVYRGLIDEENL